MSDIRPRSITPDEGKYYISKLATDSVETTVKVGAAEKFVPNINASKWGDEAWLNINMPDVVNEEKESLVDEKLSLTVGDNTHRFYETPDGRFEYEIEIAKRPASNVVSFNLSYPEGLVFYYQDTLENDYAAFVALNPDAKALPTWEEWSEGRTRPDDVVGSYAVYWAKKNNKYQTGKFCHIYRPKITDADKKETWGELDITGNTMRITIDEKWLGEARYPIIVDPTLGYTTEGGSAYGSVNGKEGMIYQADGDGGTINHFYAYVAANGSGNNCKIGIYNAPSSGQDMNGETVVEQVEMTNPSTSGNNETAASGAQSLTASNYYCVAWATEAGVTISYDDNVGTVGVYGSGYTYADEFTTGDAGWNNAQTWEYSMWVDYASGGDTGDTGDTTQDIYVETFQYDLTGTSDTHTLTNDVGSTSSAFVRSTMSGRRTCGLTTTTSNVNVDEATGTMYLSDTDEITFGRDDSNGTARFIGEVWRYEGDTGGANEFITRWQGVVNVSSGSSSNTQAVSGVSDVNKVVCFLTGQGSDNTGRTTFQDTCFRARMTSSSVLTVDRGSTGGGAEVSVAVVEFTGSNWTVAHGSLAGCKESAGRSVTMYEDYDQSGSTYTMDFEHGFIEASMEGDAGSENGLSDNLWAFDDPGTGTGTSLTMESGDGGARCDGYLQVYWIENDNLDIAREFVSKSIPTGADTSLTFPSITISDITTAALEWYVDTSGTGTAFARGHVGARLTATDTISAYVHRSGNTGVYCYGVMDLSGLVTVSAGTISCAVTDGITLTDSDVVNAKLQAAILDGIQFADTDTTLLKAIASISDGIELSDSTAIAKAIYAAIADGVDFSDSTTVYKVIQGIISDGAKLADVAVVIATLNAAISDGFIGSDAAGRYIIKQAAVADGMAFNDTDSNNFLMSAALSDGVNFSDSSDRVKTLVGLVSDQVNLSGTFGALINLLAAVTDGVTFADLCTTLGTIPASVIDGIRFGDAASALATFQAAIADGIILLDSTDWGGILSAIVGDGIVLSDSSTAGMSLLAQLADGITVSDSGQVQATFSVTASDGVEFADLVSVIARMGASVADSVTLSDRSREASTLSVGTMSVTFTAGQATVTFTIKKPAVTFSGAQPSIAFSGKAGPTIDFTGAQPSITFSGR